jgi:uncharacterized protein GlcG (DUF336 family)
MILRRKTSAAAALLGALAIIPTGALATDGGGSNKCPVGYQALKAALAAATATETSGLNFDMWGTVVDRDGIVCAVAFTGGNRGSQWPGSRVISAQKANTANSFSLNGLALSTANLYSAVQPGGSLFGLQESNPVDTGVAYKGPSSDFGTSKDPMVGKKIGGVNVFGGGLALYKNGKVVGAVGVSGDTSCADHNIGWRTRDHLGLDQMAGVGGVSGDPAHPDNIIFDITPNDPGVVEGQRNLSAGGFGHPKCLNVDTDVQDLPPVQ